MCKEDMEENSKATQLVATEAANSTILETVQNFANNTSLHGASRIVHSHPLCKRLFWIWIFFSAFSILTFNVSQLLLKYLAYEVRFNIAIDRSALINPQITLCNMRLFDELMLRELYRYYANGGLNERNNNSFQNNCISNNSDCKISSKSNKTNNIDSFIDSVSSLHHTIHTALEKASLPEDQFEWTPELLLTLNKSVIDKGATSFDDFIFYCDDSNEQCDASSFHPSILYDDVSFSKCFTYDFGLMLQRKKQLTLKNFRNRPILSIAYLSSNRMIPSSEKLINLPKSIYQMFDPTTSREGMEIHVHYPNASLSSINLNRFAYVPPGHLAKIFIELSVGKKLGQPYGNCVHEYPPESKLPKEKIYIKSVCEEACLQNQVIALCQCKTAQFPNVDSYPNNTFCVSYSDVISAFNRPTVSKVELRNAFENVNMKSQCAWDVLNNDSIVRFCSQYCPSSCLNYRYNPEVKLIKWPRDHQLVYNGAQKIMSDLLKRNDSKRFLLYAKFFKFSLNESQPNDFSQFSYEKFSESITYLQFEIKTDELQVTSETADYTIYQLVSDIGGQLGLWIGMSVITVTEIIDLLARLVLALFKRRSRNN